VAHFDRDPSDANQAEAGSVFSLSIEPKKLDSVQWEDVARRHRENAALPTWHKDKWLTWRDLFGHAKRGALLSIDNVQKRAVSIRLATDSTVKMELSADSFAIAQEVMKTRLEMDPPPVDPVALERKKEADVREAASALDEKRIKEYILTVPRSQQTTVAQSLLHLRLLCEQLSSGAKPILERKPGPDVFTLMVEMCRAFPDWMPPNSKVTISEAWNRYLDEL
jgi:hypothetical protein